MSPKAAAAAKAAGDQPIVLLALDVKGGADSAVDAAVDLRKNLHIQDNGNLALPVHLVGQQALWAGLQDVSKRRMVGLRHVAKRYARTDARVAQRFGAGAAVADDDSAGPAFRDVEAHRAAGSGRAAARCCRR